MAVTSFFPVSHIPVQNSSNPSRNHRAKIVKLRQSRFPVKKRPGLLVRSCFKNVVFEDRSEGIVCYRDDRGEIVCEGFDEGPRYDCQVQRITCYPRDAELIINLLQLRLLQTVSSNSDGKGVPALHEYFMLYAKGFNQFC